MELVAHGSLAPDTLVWREGMAQWQPYNDVRPPVVPVAAPLPGVSAAPAAHQAACAECGRAFDRQDLLAYGSIHVCAQCKPIFLQKLAEGARIETSIRYAGFWIRAGAKLLDGLILRVVGLPVSLLMMLASASSPTQTLVRPARAILMSLLGMALSLGIAMGYSVFFLGRFGATPGKMACRIKVISADGQPISYAKACVRFWAEFLSLVTALIGYIMAGFDEEKRTLHDRLCQTRVIFK